MGINLFMHSVRLVLNDWRTALRVTGLLYLIYAIPALLIGLLFPVPTTTSDPSAALGAMASFAPVGIVTALLMAVVYVWLAVTWHRYILLDEYPAGPLPPFQTSEILSYAGSAILLWLISLVVFIVVGLVTSPLAFLGVVGAILISIIIIAVALIVGYRLGLVLPSRAIGKRLTFGEAWNATKGQNGTILVLAIVSALAAVLIDVPAMVLAFLPGIGGILALLWRLATGWLAIMVGVSILTTLYGVFIEKRTISE